MKLSKQQIRTVDTQNMWELITDFADQWAEAVQQSRSINFTFDRNRVTQICLAGMGGSAIGADLIRAYSYGFCPYPVQVVRHYDIPRWIDEHTLFIACSFSGHTEETISAMQQARKRGAQVVVITSGGELLVHAARHDLDYIKIPGGMPPRTALGYSFVPLFRIFQHLEVLEEGEKALEETGLFLKEQGELYMDLNENEALTLAKKFQDHLPIVYSDATMMEPVNLRWRNQFEENAKTLAYGNTIPEMTHNEIVGWEQIVHLTGRLSVIMLYDSKDNPLVHKRMEIVRDLIKDQASTVHVLRTRGESRLCRMFSLIQLADWTSFYLAILSGVDPTPIAKIDLLKSRLAEE